MPEPIRKEFFRERDDSKDPLDGTGTVFVLTPFGARQGIEVFTRLLKLVDLGAVDKLPTLSRENSGDLFLQCLTAAQRSITPQIAISFCATFAKQCKWLNAEGIEVPLHKVGDVDHFDRLFSQQYGELLSWLWWVLETNYSSFLAGKTDSEPKSD